MNRLFAKTLVTVALLSGPLGLAQAADVENILAECRVRAATIFHSDEDAVDVKYEGRRVDKTHAVNGSVFVCGRRETFPCSFEPKG